MCECCAGPQSKLQLPRHVLFFVLPDDPKPPGVVDLEENVPGTVTVIWEASPDEKRDDRLHYTVSKLDSTKRMWSTVADRLFNNKFTVCNIMLGREYNFRVYAKNDMGISAPSESPTWCMEKKKGDFVLGCLVMNQKTLKNEKRDVFFDVGFQQTLCKVTQAKEGGKRRKIPRHTMRFCFAPLGIFNYSIFPPELLSCRKVCGELADHEGL